MPGELTAPHKRGWAVKQRVGRGPSRHGRVMTTQLSANVRASTWSWVT
jgi:hypothetical protein